MQTARLCDGDRRRAHVLNKQPMQVTRAHPEPLRQFIDAVIVDEPFLDQSQPVRVLYHVDARGLVRSTGADDVLVLPSVARFQVRVSAGGFWLDAGQAQAQPAVRPFTRAGAIEIVVDDRDGARYVKVLAL